MSWNCLYVYKFWIIYYLNWKNPDTEQLSTFLKERETQLQEEFFIHFCVLQTCLQLQIRKMFEASSLHSNWEIYL